MRSVILSFQRGFSSWVRSLSIVIAGIALGAFTLAGCDSTGPNADEGNNQGSNVTVGFSTSSSTASSSVVTKDEHDSLELTGSNGTLEITDIRLIVSEVELEGEDDRAEFEMEQPSFLDLPLSDGDVTQIASDRIPPGTYTEFEFEVDNVDLDDDDEEEEEEEIQAVRDAIEDAGFSNWPEDASMVVVGSFTPDGVEPQPFTTYFEAEIEVEIEMEDRPFEIGDDSARELTVNLDPARWFSDSGTNTVQDLSENNYQTEDDLVEFELEYEFEDGIGEIEFDD